MPALAIAIFSRNHGVFIKHELLSERREWKKFSHKSRITPLQGVKEYSHSIDYHLKGCMEGGS
jgi:hypothetical protein